MIEEWVVVMDKMGGTESALQIQPQLLNFFLAPAPIFFSAARPPALTRLARSASLSRGLNAKDRGPARTFFHLTAASHGSRKYSTMDYLFTGDVLTFTTLYWQGRFNLEQPKTPTGAAMARK